MAKKRARDEERAARAAEEEQNLDVDVEEDKPAPKKRRKAQAEEEANPYLDRQAIKPSLMYAWDVLGLDVPWDRF